MPYSQILDLLKTGISIAMYMITRLTRELRFTLLLTVRNLNQYHALCGIVKLQSNNILSDVFSSCSQIHIKLGYIWISLNPHVRLISRSSFLPWFENHNTLYLCLKWIISSCLQVRRKIYICIKRKNLEMVSIKFGATVRRYGNNYTITSTVSAVRLILRSKKHLPFSH